MQVTPGPGWGWAGGRRRLRLHLHDLRERPIRLYAPDHLRHIVRAESVLGHWSPTTADGRPRAWQDPDLMQLIQKIRFERPMDDMLRLGTGPGAGAGAGSGAGLTGGVGGVGGVGPEVDDRAWESALRGWAAGALLLAALLLLVRALERCLQRRLNKDRRRPSDEWPTANVFATSRYGGASPRLEESDTFPSESPDSNNDLPPPYSECANADTPSDDNKPTIIEEPPPPYSACYFSNPKNGLPTVHFYSRRGGEVGESSRTSDATIISVPEIEADAVSRDNQRCEVSVCDEVNSDLQNATNEAASRERVDAPDLSKPAKDVSV